MPQYSADELTARLVAAIDPQGHVKDMVVVSEVVTMLETMHITAEHLKATRLGKHINTVRRQLSESNKSLAKRMKTLVKSWQQLLQARPSTTNGLPPTPQQTSTPTNPPRASSPLALNTSTRPTPPPPAAKNEEPTYSPVKPHDANKLTITSSSPQTVRELFSEGEKVTNGTQSQGVASDPAKNRRKLLKLLSKVKKPTVQPLSSPGATNNSDVPLTTEPSNQPINTFSNSNFTSIDENNGSSTSNGRDASLKPTPSSVDSEDCSSLRVCLPRGAIARTPQTSRKTVHKKHKRLKQEVLDSLSVSLPRNLIRLKSKQIIPTITSSDSLNMEATLVVSIPIMHYTKKKNHHSSSGKMSGKKMRDTFLEPTGPVQPVTPANPVQKSLDIIEPPILRMPHKTLLNSDNQEAEPMEVDDISHTTEDILDNTTTENNQTSHEDEGPSTELSTMSYCFTEPVSNSELTSVMLLPYVYIDGVTDEV